MYALAVAALVVTTAGVYASPPRGRVVRVERVRDRGAAPVLCMIQEDLSGICLGAGQPLPGSTVVIVGDDGPVAELRLAKVKNFVDNRPRCEAMWHVRAELVRGDMDKAPRHRPNGIIDRASDPRRTRFVQTDDGHGRGLGFDNDRDGKADVVFSEASCDGAGDRGDCIGVFTRDGNQLLKVATVDMRPCYGASTPPAPTP